MRERAERLAIPIESLRDYLTLELPSESLDAFDFWFPWLLDPSEAHLRHRLIQLVGKLHRAASKDKFDTVRHYFRVLDFGYRYCREDPMLSTYEYHVMSAYAIVSSMHFIAGQPWFQAVDLQKLETALEERDMRRRNAGLDYRPSSELRMGIASSWAWVLTEPEYSETIDKARARDLAARYWGVADSVMSRLHLISEMEQAGLLLFAAFGEIKICQLAFLVDRDFYLDAVARFNLRYKGDLAETTKVTISRDETIRTAWYWDMEVWKLIHQDDWDEELLQFARRERSLAVRLTYSELATPGSEIVWARREAARRRIVLEQKAQASDSAESPAESRPHLTLTPQPG